MSVELFVVRHAVAFDRDPKRWPDDSLRPLTPEGEAEFRRAASGLATVTKPVHTVLSSPYARAWRTAELLHETAGWPAPQRFDALEADRDPEETIDALADLRETKRIAIVGHDPMLSTLCGILAGGTALELEKGAVARLSVRAFEPDGGTVRWLLPPKVLTRLER